jgi:ferrous iron transport protein B
VPTASVELAPGVERAAEGLASQLGQLVGASGADARWLALRLLERDDAAIGQVVTAGVLTRAQVEEAASSLEAEIDESVDISLAEARYRFVEDVAAECLSRPPATRTTGEHLDGVVLHRLLGIPIFLGVMYLLFWFAISVGGAFIDFFDLAGGAIFVDGSRALLVGLGAPAWVVTVLADGVGAGIQTVLTFIPIILAMFLGLALLEDSGYMSRAAFVMDRFMRAIGLPGKSFVPMLIGFGCNVPAIMATRTLEHRRDRYLTIFMNPFMSCGARLPVYALFGAAFFGAAAGGMTFALYGVGIVAAILTGLMLKRTLFQGEPSYMIMELPPYHRPRLGTIVRSATQRMLGFMTRAKFIIPIVTILAVLNSLGTNGTFGNEDTSDSVLSGIGRAITPVFTPMGVEQDNWPATVGIFTGILAKETVVGTLNALYGQEDASEASGAEAGSGASGGFDLVAALGAALATIPDNLAGLPAAFTDPFGFGVVGGSDQAVADEVGASSSVFTGLRTGFSQGQPQVVAYLLFVLLYVPCVAATAAMTREMGAHYTLLAVAHIGIVAWSSAVLFYQLVVAHDPVWVAVAAGLLLANVALFWFVGVRERAGRAALRPVAAGVSGAAG